MFCSCCVFCVNSLKFCIYYYLICFLAPLIPQNLIREFEGIHIIAGFISDAEAEVRVQTLSTLNNLCMNLQNQEQIKVCCHIHSD